MKRIRSISQATGGLTESEWDALSKHHAHWSQLAKRTTTIDRDHIQSAITNLYSAASLSVPTVVVVPSPGVMAFAGTFARHILQCMSRDERYIFSLPEPTSIECNEEHHLIVSEVISALSKALETISDSRCIDSNADVYGLTLNSTYGVIDAPTAEAMDRQTNMDIREGLDHQPLHDMNNAIWDAMRDPFGNPTMTDLIRSHINNWGLQLARSIFRNEDDASAAINNVCDWWTYSQSGAADCYWDYCITATIDVLGLRIPGINSYKIWEECTKQCAYRYMHPAFCLVSDFPSKVTDKNLTSIVLGSGQNYYYWHDGWVV